MNWRSENRILDSVGLVTGPTGFVGGRVPRVAAAGARGVAAAWLGVALGVAGADAPAPAAGPSLPRGEVVEHVACRADPTKSYALYLPSGYDASRPWPVVFALDPGARGRVPVERFRAAAETYGYVVAGSNDSRNGPLEPSARAVAAVIDDARSRLRLDERRFYLAGFSGGARAASAFARAVKVAGLVACGAGLGEGLEPASIAPAYYLGVVGALDFNYLEMRELDRVLQEKGVAHRLILTEERHAWPPADVCTRALAWLELVAMTTGLRPRDEALIASVLDAEEGAAGALERKGDLEWAAVAYEGTAPVARALRPASTIPDRLEALRANAELRRQVKKEDGRARTERETLARFGRALVRVRDAPTAEVSLERVPDELGLDRLVEAGRAASGSKDGQMTLRLLASLTVQARSLGRAALDAGDGTRAGLFFETAMRASALDARLQNDLRVWLACARSRAGDSKGALKLLREAAAAGFDERAFLLEEPSLASLRGRPEFQEILRSLPAVPPTGP
jgi:predicted esterase